MYPKNYYKSKTFKTAPFISLVAGAHLVVDAACAYLLLGVLNLSGNVLLALLLYNSMAFVLQAPLGWLIDKRLDPRLAAMLGLVGVASSFLFTDSLYVALILFSVGNALYHVGAGSLVLSLNEKKATFAGIFVAPGAIGLSIGSFLSVSGMYVAPYLFPVVLLVLCGLVYVVKTPVFTRKEHPSTYEKVNYALLLILFILLSISIRSMIGLSMDYPWKQNQLLSYLLLAAVVGGKVVGGVLADTFGLIKVGVGSLLLSAALLSFYGTVPSLAIPGAFFFNFSMPITLIAILTILPENKGLSFGLTTVAIFIGSLPIFLDESTWLDNELIVFALILLSSLALFVALRVMDKPGK